MVASESDLFHSEMERFASMGSMHQTLGAVRHNLSQNCNDCFCA